MKKIVAVFCLLLSTAALYAKDKPNPADFNIKIHISATQLIPTNDLPTLVAETVLDGKKVKLAGNMPLPPHGIHLLRPSIIVPGDYQIRLKKDWTEKDSGTLNQEYELLLPDGATWDCWIIGISE
ncbi:MAG: hypothetical protein ABSC48_19210 [Terracidiphilus sp.]